ncbi:MAG: UDP-N-acetylmuramate--L-alanine ligase [Sediminibacterium sp.]
MPDQLNISSIYFIGIGGIGMSALARYFKSRGAAVSGYDKAASPLTNQLEAEGIDVHYIEDLELIPKKVDCIVYTPAVPAQHAELTFYRNNGYRVVKRSDVLQWITENTFNICIAGTHGKTTVSTMVAHILRHSGYGCNAFLGGISANYGTNFWSNERAVAVIEADEYDRSFLKLSPDIAVITAIDPDHLDIYGTAEEVEKAFQEFSGRLKQGGRLIYQSGIGNSNRFKTKNIISYSASDSSANVAAANIHLNNGTYFFDVMGKAFSIHNLMLTMGGRHNIENAVASIIVAVQLGIEEQAIREALAEFKGVRRRFEYRWNEEGRVLIDDYAHHPEELRALINGVRDIYPDEKIRLVFQPHLFSRTKDLAEGFAESLDLADEVILLPIYPARELPVEGVESVMIRDKMKKAIAHIMTRESCKEWINDTRPSLLVMAGAGDIDQLINEVVNNYKNAKNA